MRWNYAQTLCYDPSSTLDELHEAVSTLEDSERIARRVFGGAHPLTTAIEQCLRNARAALRARDGGDVDVESTREAMGAMTARDA